MEQQHSLVICWFCNKQKADDKSGALVEMHRPIDHKGTELQTLDASWEPATVYVPRCVSCKTVHDRTESHVRIGWLIGLAVGLVIGLSAYINVLVGWFIVPIATFGTAMLGGLITWLLSRTSTPKEVRDQGQATKHPDVRRKEEEGWKIGAKPLGER